jgi:endonuclease YncB( thermonuclease family)
VVTTEVRLAGVDAPETRGRLPCEAHRTPGLAATGYVAALGLDDVALVDIEQDKYGGRVVARLILPDGRDLSEMLIAEGLAWPYGEEDPLCAPDGRVSGAAED